MRRNQAYGHEDVLRAYVETRLPHRITSGELQHGWNFDCGIVGSFTGKHMGERGERERAKRYFVWNRRNLEKAMERGYTNVIAIGAPFLYLPPVTPSNLGTAGSRSLLLFPIHTWEGEPFADPVETYRAYLEEIQDVLSLFEPVTVCLYWLQYENEEIVRLFTERGIAVVTMGPRDYNPHFLRNLQELIATHTYVSSNVFSSAVFYSLYMHKKVFLCGKSHLWDIQRMDWPIYSLYDPDEYSTLYPELLWESFDDESHYSIGDKELGLEYIRAPEELRRLLGWSPAGFVLRIPYRAYMMLVGLAQTPTYAIREMQFQVASDVSRGRTYALLLRSLYRLVRRHRPKESQDFEGS